MKIADYFWNVTGYLSPSANEVNSKEKETEKKVASTAEKALQWLLEKRLGSRKTQAENYLLAITGNEEILRGLSQFIPVLNVTVRHLIPDIVEKYIGTESYEGIEAYTSPILPFLISNLGRAAFPTTTLKLSHENLALKLSHEDLTTGIIKNTFREVLEQLYHVDEEIAKKTAFNQDLFVKFADAVMKLLLPTSGTWLQQREMGFVNSFLKDFLIKFLYQTYSQFLIEDCLPAAKDKSSQSSKEIWTIVESSVQKTVVFCLNSLAKTTINEEEVYFQTQFNNRDISATLNIFMRPLAKKFYSKLPEFLSLIKPEEFQQILKALIFKLIGNILRSLSSSKRLSNQLSSDEILKYLFEYFRNLIHQEFTRISGNKIIQKTDYEPIIERLLSTILNDSSLACWLLKKFPFIKIKTSEFLFDLHAKLKLDPDQLFYMNKLKNFFWDESVFWEACPRAAAPPTDIQARAEVIGIEPIVNLIDRFCQNIGDVSVDLLISKGQDPVLQKLILDTLVKTIQLENNPLLNQLIKVSFDILLEENKINIEIREFIKKWISHTLFKWIVILIEKGGEAEGVKSRDRALFFAFKYLLTSLKPHFLSAQKFLEIEEKKSDEEFNKIFWQLSKTLAIILKGSNGYFPFPKSIDDYLTDELQNSWLPNLIAYFYKEFSREIDQTRTYVEELSKIYHHHRISEMIHLLSQYVKQLIPNYLFHNSEHVAELLMKPLSIFMNQPVEQISILKNLLQGFFKGAGDDQQNNEIDLVFDFLQRYVEAFLLKKFLYFFQTTQKLEIELKTAGKSSLYEHIVLKSLTEAEKHFKAINGKMGEMKMEHASKIPYEKMKTHFVVHQLLHPALEDKNAFYQRITPKILAILDIKNCSDLPAPFFLQPTLWSLLIEMLMPLVAEKLFTLMMDPHSLHQYLRALLKSINDSLKSADENIHQEPYLMPDDTFQGKLADVLGNLTCSLIDLQPTFIKLHRSRYLKEVLGTKLGEKVRPIIGKDNLLELFDQLIQLIGGLHGGGWAKHTDVTLFKQLNKIPPLGNGDVFVPIRNGKIRWDFQLPKSKEEEAEQSQTKLKLNQQTRNAVRKELSDMIEQQAYLSFQAAMNELWRKFQENFDNSVKENFGDFGSKVKSFFDKMCQFFWKYILEPIFKIMTWPAKRIGKAASKQYFNQQARMRVEDIESTIHSNLMFSLLEELVRIFDNPPLETA